MEIIRKSNIFYIPYDYIWVPCSLESRKMVLIILFISYIVISLFIFKI